MVAAESADGEIPPGTVVLGRYQVLGKLAQGGMAEVYLARQVGPGGYQKLVVTKRVRPHLSKDEDFVGMFVNEARLAAMINHPNVVQIFDLGEEPSDDPAGSGTDWFLAMEYLDGRDMLQVGRACRSHNKAVPFDVTARIIADACAGLEHAHNLKGADGRHLDLVHRDMSPENIIITFEGQVKVVDFGIAKAADNSIRTQAGQIKGKLGYVAPEAILGKPVDARADIFAVGATLYLFLSGRPAFTGNSPMEIFERSLKTPPSPQEVNPRVPPVLDEICMKALAQDREKRYRTAGEVRAALDAYLASTGRPLGAPQLSQFMRILFPPDKDPVRQRIDKLVADAPQFAGARAVPKSGPGAQPRTVSVPQMPQASAPAPLASDNDRTAVVAPRAVEIGPVGEMAQASTFAQQPIRPAGGARPSGPSHLRSVGVSDEIPEVSNVGRRGGDDKTVLTAPRPNAAPTGPQKPVMTDESVDVVRTMDIEALDETLGGRALGSKPSHLAEATLGVDIDVEQAMAAALAEDDDMDGIADHPTMKGQANIPLPSSDPGSPVTVQSPVQRSFSGGTKTGIETSAGTGTEIAPPSFESSSPGMTMEGAAEVENEDSLFKPPDPGLSQEELEPPPPLPAPGTVSIGLRLLMAFLGIATGGLILFIALAVTGKLAIILGS